VPGSRNGSRELLSWSSAPLQSSTVSHPPVLPRRRGPRKREPNRSGTRVRLSWGSCPFERIYVGCPSTSHPGPVSGRSRRGDRSEPGEGRQPLAGAVHRVLAPLDGSGLLAARPHPADVPPQGASFAVATRRFAALFHAARVPGAPLRAFPSRGAVPALTGLCFLASSRSTTASAALDQLLAIAFTDAPALCRAFRTRRNARRRSRDDGSLRSLGQPV